jgi:proteasome lid subunit RPN8/RPN11
MMPANTRLEAGIWSVPGHTTVIEYARPVLNEILDQVVNAYDTYLAGGYEVGGVLFGQHEGHVVRILACRQLQILPPRPSFMLSKSDGQRMEELLRLPGSDVDLSGMVVVGWYHSHTRSEIYLSEGDLEIYDTYFPEPWQVAMVLHPSDVEPVRAGFFFREGDGFIRTDQSYQEFAVDMPAREPAFRKQPPWEIMFDGNVKEPPLPEVDPEEYALPPEPEQPAWWRRAVSWLMLLLAIGAIAAGALSIAWMRRPDAALGLKLQPGQGELNIGWDVASPSIQKAEDAILFILDGRERHDVPLNKRQLMTPGRAYKPRTSRVDIRLRVRGSWGRTQEEVATYLANPEIGKPSPELVQARKEEAHAAREVAALRDQMSESGRQAEELIGMVADLERRRLELIEARKPKRLVLPATAPKPSQAKDLPNAPDIAMRGASPLPQLTPSQAPLRPPVDPPKPPPLTPAPAPARPSVATVPTTAPTPAAKPQGPTSGRFIWTGDLPRNGVLTIDGRKASRGFVNGELPGIAVQVGAYPAELTNEGLKVFTGNPKFGAAGRVEDGSAANGWQKTKYMYDPKAMSDLIVEQMPGPQNYKQIVVRAGSKRLGLIVVEWQVVPQ